MNKLGRIFDREIASSEPELIKRIIVLLLSGRRGRNKKRGPRWFFVAQKSFMWKLKLETKFLRIQFRVLFLVNFEVFTKNYWNILRRNEQSLRQEIKHLKYHTGFCLPATLLQVTLNSLMECRQNPSLSTSATCLKAKISGRSLWTLKSQRWNEEEQPTVIFKTWEVSMKNAIKFFSSDQNLSFAY